jgi:hypothetical protein
MLVSCEQHFSTTRRIDESKYDNGVPEPTKYYPKVGISDLPPANPRYKGFGGTDVVSDN